MKQRCPNCKETNYKILDYSEEMSDNLYFQCNTCLLLWSYGYIGIEYVPDAINSSCFVDIYKKYTNDRRKRPKQLEIRNIRS